MTDELDDALDYITEAKHIHAEYDRDFIITFGYASRRWAALSKVRGYPDPVWADSISELRREMDAVRHRIHLNQMRGEGGTWTS